MGCVFVVVVVVVVVFWGGCFVFGGVCVCVCVCVCVWHQLRDSDGLKRLSSKVACFADV